MQMGLAKWLIVLGAVSSTAAFACDKHKTTSPEVQTAKVQAPLANAETKQKTAVQVLDFVLTKKIEGREPVETMEGFTTADAKGFAFARLSATEATDVTFVWIHAGREVAHFTTHVHAAKQWRTFSSVKLRSGEWKVVLKQGQEILAEKEFSVT